MQKTALSSEPVASKLLFCIYATIGLTLILSANTLYEMVDPTGAQKYVMGIGILGVITLIILLFLIVYFVVWVYRLHKDLYAFFPDYSISPKKAMAMTLIPVYNAWGIWKLTKELFVRFQVNDISLSWFTIRIQSLYVWMLVLGGIENALSRFMAKDTFKTLEVTQKLGMEALSTVLSITQLALWYIILTLVMKGIRSLNEKDRLL